MKILGNSKRIIGNNFEHNRCRPSCTRTEVTTYVLQIVTYVVVLTILKKGMETKVGFGGAMMRVLELLQLAKRHVSGWNSEEIKYVAIAIIELCLSEGVGLYNST